MECSSNLIHVDRDSANAAVQVGEVLEAEEEDVVLLGYDDKLDGVSDTCLLEALRQIEAGPWEARLAKRGILAEEVLHRLVNGKLMLALRARDVDTIQKQLVSSLDPHALSGLVLLEEPLADALVVVSRDLAVLHELDGAIA